MQRRHKGHKSAEPEYLSGLILGIGPAQTNQDRHWSIVMRGRPWDIREVRVFDEVVDEPIAMGNGGAVGHCGT